MEFVCLILLCCQSLQSYLFFFLSLYIIDNISAAPINVKKKKSTKKFLNSTQSTNNSNNNNNNINSYEHHLEKWIENTSKMNFDYSNENNYNNFHLMNSSFQQPYRNNNNNNNNRNHLQQQQQQQHQHSSMMMDPNTSLPSQQFVSAFLNYFYCFGSINKKWHLKIINSRKRAHKSAAGSEI